jgi:hypothetical protein
MNKELRPITKALAGTLRQDGTGRVLRRECWEATTTDGEWAFERIEEPGTPWIVVHHPRTPAAETLSHTFGTLKAARQAVESGWAGPRAPVSTARRARQGQWAQPLRALRLPNLPRRARRGLGSPPRGGGAMNGYPLVCTECREHVYKDCEDLLDTPHCIDEDTGEVGGTLVEDLGYDFTYDDPSIP